jgi:hypothetical protein
MEAQEKTAAVDTRMRPDDAERSLAPHIVAAASLAEWFGYVVL